jgi:hypothetical protein
MLVLNCWQTQICVFQTFSEAFNVHVELEKALLVFYIGYILDNQKHFL